MRHGHIHVILDDHSQPACAETHDDELGVTATAVLRRAAYEERSLFGHVDALDTPLAVFQSDEDAVAPPD